MLWVNRTPQSTRSTPGVRRWGPGGARAFVAALALVAIATATLLRAGVAPFGSDATTALAIVLIAAVTLANLTRLGTHAFAPSTLFMAALAVFHLGMIASVAAGLDEPPFWLAALSERSVAAALLAIVLAFACLEIGLVLGWGSTRPRPPSLRPIPTAPQTASALHGGGLAAAAIAVAAAVANLATIGFDRFFEASYGYELYATTDSRLLQMGFFWLLPAASLVCFAGARRGREARRALALVATTTGLLLCAGDRGGAISLLSGALVVWTTTRGPLPRRIAVGAALAVLVLVPTIAAIRQLPRNAVDLASIRDAASAASPLAALTEMGATFRPLVETMRLVPEAEPYRLGRTYLAAALRVLPNLGLSRADDDWRDPDELPPNTWITYTVAPWTFAAYGGLGYSAVAEPYLNFGVLGIATYFLALGVALGRFEVRFAQTPSRRMVALAAVIFMSFLLTVRNDVQNFIRPAVWAIGLIALIEVVHGGRSVRRRAPFPRGALGARAARPAARSDAATAAHAGTLARGVA
ncbi:MAG: O-antigen polysaccharide polymerase Wzy [Deltaproteobacteria bacterium]|nr:O-antigen polysaccharide polymerase Wzy [Deltaproteobacteria bacterium]